MGNRYNALLPDENRVGEDGIQAVEEHVEIVVAEDPIIYPADSQTHFS